MAGINIGNIAITGFVNMVADNRVLIGSGSYTNKEGQRVFKESVTLFIDKAFDGIKVAKGDFVRASGDLYVGPRKDKEGNVDLNVLNATINVRFENQLIKLEPPRKAEAAASAGAAADDDDI